MSDIAFRYVAADIPSWLTAAEEVPGGFVALDLLRPGAPIHVEADDRATLTTGDGAPPAVPDEWIRVGLVTGVDRWLDLPSDRQEIRDWSEELLQADLALAHSLVGNNELAEYFWERSGETLTAVARRTLDDRHPWAGYGAFLDELRQVYSRFPDRDRDIEAQLEHVNRAAGLAPQEKVLVRTKGGSRHNQVEVVTDPRLVPARLFTRPEAILDHRTIRVEAIPFRKGSGTSPTAARMTLQVFAKSDRALVAFGPLPFDGTTFRAVLPLAGDYEPADLIVEVFDLGSSTGPYAFDDLGRTELLADQGLFTRARLAGADTALARTGSLDAAWLQEGERKLSPIGVDDLRAAVEAIAPAAPGNGPLRPLLAELANELGIPT